MLEINFHRNDLVKTGPIKSAVDLENYLAVLTETGDLIVYSSEASAKPKLSPIFTKSFPNAISMCAYKNDFVVMLQQSNPHITMIQISKSKIVLETNCATQCPTRLFNCKSNICVLDENDTVFVYTFSSKQLNNFLTEGIY